MPNWNSFHFQFIPPRLHFNCLSLLQMFRLVTVHLVNHNCHALSLSRDRQADRATAWPIEVYRVMELSAQICSHPSAWLSLCGACVSSMKRLWQSWFTRATNFSSCSSDSTWVSERLGDGEYETPFFKRWLFISLRSEITWIVAMKLKGAGRKHLTPRRTQQEVRPTGSFESESSSFTPRGWLL